MTKPNKPNNPKASDWQNRPLDDWNTSTFTHYLQDLHRTLYGVEYAPWRGWRVEQGLIANVIGNASGSKPQTHPPAVLKEFIDACFAEYRPSAKYPGISFGFMWTYKKNVWQRTVAAQQAKERADRRREAAKNENIDDLMEWL